MIPLLIAEIGSSPAPAWAFERWAATARLAGATALKAQLFYAEHFPRDEWASKRPLEFPRKRLPQFVAQAHGFGLQAGVSVFDDPAVTLAQAQCDFLKLAAREQDNLHLIEECYYAHSAKSVFRSISRRSVDEFMFLDNAVTLFAIQKYPAGLIESLIALLRWAQHAEYHAFCWGWSSHTTSTLDCRLAARLGARVIEKHLCLTPDDLEAGHSLTPTRFKAMALAIKGEA
jgi:sialic acid synthase SpsE